MRGVQWLVVLWCWQLPAFAGVVGSFDGVRNLPGYIDLQRGADTYRSPIKIPKRRGDGIEHRTASRILREDYLRDDGSIDVKAITRKILAIRKHEHVAFLAYCVNNLPRRAGGHTDWCRSHADEKMQAKWRRKKLAANYAFAIAELQLAKQLAVGVTAKNINHASSQTFLEHLFQGLETFASILDQDPVNSEITSAFLYGIDFKKIRIGFAIEPANLVIPEAFKKKHPQLREQVFFSPRQLQHFARSEGLDSAALDPLDSGFWRKPRSIRTFDTRNYNGQSNFPIEVTDPEQEIAVTYDWKARFTGRTPKMRVHYKGKRYKMKYLSQADNIEHTSSLSRLHMNWRKHSSEINTETAVNNLAAALGFTVDPTFFKSSVKLYLPLKDPTSAAEFAQAHQRLIAAQRHWRGYGRPEIALSDVHTDDRGHHYIRVRSVSLEQRSELDYATSVGSYLKSAFSRPFKREFRAFALFSAWVNDTDVKDDNSSIVLVGNASNRRVAYSASDMGATLGRLIFGLIMGNDSPNFLTRDIIERVRRRPDNTIYEVILNYRSTFSNSGLSVMSISDAKWMTRMIAQLSPAQIRNAFLAAGYSEMLSEYYTQIMLRRRDQLVETFGLMGKTLIDAEGIHIPLKHETKMTDPDTYAVEGYEEYFKDGYLHDPEGKVANNPSDFVRRYYDRDIKNATPGTLQNALWESVKAWTKINAISATTKRLHKLKVTNRTFGLQLLDGDLCESECFYDGLRIGITNFLPQRFLLENPYDDREKPLLLVDVYRFGFLFGADIGTDFPSRFGIDAPLNDNLPQVRYQRVYEFIKVKPLDSIVSSTKNLKDLSPMQILKYNNIHQQLVDDLQRGEALIASTYISRGAGVKLGKYPFLGRPQVSAGFDLKHIVVSRKSLIKGEGGNMLLQFSDLKATKFWLGLEGELLLNDFPLVSLEMEKLSKMDLLYEFSPEQGNLHLIEKNLAATSPHGISEFAVAERYIDANKRKFSKLLSPAKFFFDETDASTIKLDKDKETHELHVARVQDKQDIKYVPFGSQHQTMLESFVTRDDKVFIRLNMKYENAWGKRDNFKWVYENMLPLLGKQFILFTPADVNYYLDDFEFNGEVYILPAGVDNIMAYLEQPMLDFCVRYANAAGASYPRRWCAAALQGDTDVHMQRGHRRGIVGRAARSDHSRFRRFTASYIAAVRSWQQSVAADLPVAKRDELLRRKAHKIAQLFSTNGFSPTVWKVLQNIAGEENIYRNAILTSRTGGFPAQYKEIVMPANLQGKAEGHVPTVFREIVQSVQIATDPLFAGLEGIFYEPMGEDEFAID